MKSIWLLLLTFYTSGYLVAQVEVSGLDDKDIEEIKTSGIDIITEYEALLNLISDESVGHVERNKVIEQSYNENSGQQIFKSSNIIIEDDLNGEEGGGDLQVEVYLKKFDLLYTKQSTASIRFKNIQVSEVLKNQYIYIEVYFESYFGGNNIVEDETYTFTKRVATIEAKREKGTVWDLKIVGITFYNPVVHKFPQAKNIPIQKVTISWESSLLDEQSEYIIYHGEKLIGTTSDTFFKISPLIDLKDIQIFKIEPEKLNPITTDSLKVANQEKKVATTSPIPIRKQKHKTNAVGILILMVSIPLILMGIFKN